VLLQLRHERLLLRQIASVIFQETAKFTAKPVCFSQNVSISKSFEHEVLLGTGLDLATA
jgi:hypothetical protein